MPDAGIREPGARDHGAVGSPGAAARRQARGGGGVATLSNPRDAFFAELGELLWIERTLVFEVLPPAIESVRDAELKEALEAHLEETKLHVARVESTFRAAGAEPAAARSAALAGLKSDHESQDVREPTLRDVQTATASIRVEHLELAVYESVMGLARVLRVDTDLLAQNRKDEEQALKLLRKIAERLRGDVPRSSAV